jgi:hypothetical protein
MKRTVIQGLGVVLAGLAAWGPAVAAAQESPAAPAPGKPDATSNAETKTKSAKPPKSFEFDVTGAVLGALDSNVFDKGDNPILAGGVDVDLSLQFGIPVGKRLSWIVGLGFGSNFRGGLSGDVAASALKIDANAKTGLEVLLAGKSSLPGRHVKKSVFPVVKLGVEVKYALTTNPLTTEKKTDVGADALAPADEADDVSDSTESGDSANAEEAADEADAEDDGEEEAEASSGASGQTFSNPNTHHKGSGVARLTIEPTKTLTLGADVGGARDFVNLTNVETSPQYSEFTGGVNVKYKIHPKYLSLSAGYSYERRSYDEQKTKSGEDLQFDVHGGKLGIDVPLNAFKIKAVYDVKYKFVGVDETTNQVRHQGQLVVEVPLIKNLAAVADGRLSSTVPAAAPSALRFIGLAGLKMKF